MNTRSRNIIKAKFLSVRNAFTTIKDNLTVLLYKEKELDVSIPIGKEYSEHAPIIMYLISKHFNIVSLKYKRFDNNIHVVLRGMR